MLRILVLVHVLITAVCLLEYILVIKRCKRLKLYNDYGKFNIVMDYVLCVLPCLNIALLLFHGYYCFIVDDFEFVGAFSSSKK